MIALLEVYMCTSETGATTKRKTEIIIKWIG